MDFSRFTPLVTVCFCHHNVRAAASDVTVMSTQNWSISHFESMKAFKSSVYSAAAIGISWFSSAGRIWSFCARAPSGLWMEIYYWSQNRASLNDTNDNCSFSLIAISIYRAALEQRHSVLFLDGQFPAKFSSNLPKHTCPDVSSNSEDID